MYFRCRMPRAASGSFVSEQFARNITTIGSLITCQQHQRWKMTQRQALLYPRLDLDPPILLHLWRLARWLSILLAVTCAEISVFFFVISNSAKRITVGGGLHSAWAEAWRSAPFAVPLCISNYSSGQVLRTMFITMDTWGCGLFIMTGCIGVGGTLWVNKVLYSSIKIGEGKEDRKTTTLRRT